MLQAHLHNVVGSNIVDGSNTNNSNKTEHATEEVKVVIVTNSAVLQTNSTSFQVCVSQAK